ncbi:MAG: molybdopterin synthase [ANME-2 cluster archaeon]|nr:molybdopterin synthase [ANME-2 cluster archaeon]
MKVISVVGHKKSGKTTLVCSLVEALGAFGRVGTVKHMMHHRFNPENTDTGKQFDAGAEVVVGITASELVTVAREPTLEKALNALANSGMDFAIIEGDKESSLPKIVLGDLDYPSGVSNVVANLPEHADVDIAGLVEVIRSQPDWVTLELLVRKVRSNPAIQKAGAIGTFTGIVREMTGDVQTETLEFEQYESLARESIEKISTELKEKDGIMDVVIHHKTGKIRPGEDIVYIVVASSHRTQLFPVLSEAIERVKSEVPIWKKEMTTDGEFWVHDHA